MDFKYRHNMVPKIEFTGPQNTLVRHFPMAIRSTQRAQSEFQLPRRVQRRLLANDRKLMHESANDSIVDMTEPRDQSNQNKPDVVNIMIVNHDKNTRKTHNRDETPVGSILATLPANTLQGIIVKLSTHYAIKSVLSLTKTCRTLADRITIYKIVRLNVEPIDAVPQNRIENILETEAQSYTRIPYAQLQIDSLYPTIHRYGSRMEIYVISPTHAVLKKKAVSGTWGHSILIENGMLIHVHNEYNSYTVSLYQIGHDVALHVAPMFADLGMPCLLGFMQTSCFILSSKNMSYDKTMPVDDIIGKMIHIVVDAVSNGTNPAVIRADNPAKRIITIIKIVRGWSEMITDVQSHPNQFIMRTVRNEPITRWSAETVDDGVTKAFCNTMALTASQ